jgi:hypothetical protein
MPNTRR